jgi:hypothetical protein
VPLTSKGNEILSNMEKQYGPKKGEKVFYASKNKGTITGVDAMFDHDVRELKRCVDVHFAKGGELAAKDDWSPEARKAAAEARKKGSSKPKTDLEREREAMSPKERAAARKSDREKQGAAWSKEREAVYARHAAGGRASDADVRALKELLA